ncbi:MAG: NAD(P)/FAD-dependent oxidoreductase [Chitinophagaceae bacterium]
MQQTELKSSYDVVVVGSGIGGLTAAALLSKAGLSVCVLEKEPHPGGYLAGFRRKDFRFDTAIHWLNQYRKDGMVFKIFDLIGEDYPKAVPQKRVRRYKGDDYEYLLTNTPDDLKKQWQQEFPDDAEGIERFFKAAKKVGEAFEKFGYIFRTEETMGFWERLKNKRNLIRFGMYFIPHLRFTGDKGIKKGLSKYFKNEKLHKVFSADAELLSCIVPIGWAYANDYQSPPPGGGQVIAEWLEHVIHYFGQETHYRCEVQEILTKEGTARGVLFKKHNKEYRIESKYVIAACDAPALYEKMLSPSLIPAKLKANLRAAELYSSSLTISIALDCPVEELGFNEELVHVSSACASRSEHISGNPDLTEISILAPSFRDHSLAPEGQGTLVLFMPAYMNFENEWRTEKDEAGNFVRGAAYKELKREIAQRLIERVEKKVAPGLQKHILFYDVATPVTHWRYTGNTGGSMMATKPNRPNMVNKVATYHTPVKNLFLGGHWAELGGGVPIAAKAGANAALLVLKQENRDTFKMMAGYMDGKVRLDTVLSCPTFKNYQSCWQQRLTPAQKSKLRKDGKLIASGDDEE